jgi:RNA polymerase sigma factor (sigma-70 family)
LTVRKVKWELARSWEGSLAEIEAKLANRPGFRGSPEQTAVTKAIAEVAGHRRPQRESLTHDMEAAGSPISRQADGSSDNPLSVVMSRDPVLAVKMAELRTALHSELQSMPQLDRELLRLTYQEGMTRRQAAEALGIAVSTAQVRLSKALAKLATRLAAFRRHYAE